MQALHADAWRALGPLPRVAPWNKGRRSLTWEERRDAWAAMPMGPLVVTAELVTPIIHAERDATHLDGPLSFGALTSHPVASAWDQAAVLPLPLALAWVSPQGLPLWACTPLRPVGERHDAREYWHKRYPSHRADFGSRVNAVTTAGRWKEYRVPVATQQVGRLQALAIGHAAEVRALLSVVTHLGKKGGMGYGRVARWTVEDGGHTLDDVLAARAVPVAAFGGAMPPGPVAPLRGWTPPYWHAPWWGDCVLPVGGRSDSA